jgi:hypothetical protein
VGEGHTDQIVHERLRRATFFHVLILVKIIVRRVPLFKKGWDITTTRMIERAAQVLREALEA